MEEETGAIVVRKDVMHKFHSIVAETRLDANELMEHFFALYHCCVKLVQPLQREPGTLNTGMAVKNEAHKDPMTSDAMMEPDCNHDDDNDVTILGYSMDPKKQMKVSRDSDEDSELPSSSTEARTAIATASSLLTTLSSLTGQGALSDPVRAFQSLLAMYRREDGQGTKSTQAFPKRVMATNCSKPEDVLKKVMCSLCQATFDRFTDLLAHHKDVHNSDLSHPLRCKACGRTQTSEAGLVHHQIYVCKNVERPHTCDVCTLRFASEEMVWVHKCSGDIRKRFACEFCDHYKTESASDLEKHMRIHTGDKCYRCESCGFQTAWKKNLKEHMIKHTGLKPFACSSCSFSTADKHNLRVHNKGHAKDQVGCSDCGSTLNRPHKDANSNKTTDVTKPYKCCSCDYRAKYRSVLQLHEARHSKKGSVDCSTCGLSFSQHKDLLHHRATVHADLTLQERVMMDSDDEERSLTLLTSASSSQSPRQPAETQTSSLTASNTHNSPKQHQTHQLSHHHHHQHHHSSKQTSSSHTAQHQDSSLLSHQDLSPLATAAAAQQTWKSPMGAGTHPLNHSPGSGSGQSLFGKGLHLPPGHAHAGMPTSSSALSSASGFQQGMGQHIGLQPGLGLSPWATGMGAGSVQDLFGARMTLGHSAGDSFASPWSWPVSK